MPVEVTCPSCGTSWPMRDQYRGRLMTCPDCGTKFSISTEATVAEDVAPVDADIFSLTSRAPTTYQREESEFGFRCPFCSCRTAPRISSVVSTAGWVFFIILLLSGFLACFAWVALFMREERRHCSSCGIKLG